MKILLADDHQVVRRGLMQMLAEEYPAAVFGEADTAARTLELAREKRWDLLVLDISLPDRNGLEVLAELAADRLAPRVLVLSMSPEEEFAVRALKRGARGYLTKRAVADELLTAVRRILAGGRYITPATAEQLVSELADGEEMPPHERLSEREMEVLRLIAGGRSVKEIAAALGLCDKTVFTYRDRLRSKLGIKSDVDLARYAFQHHLADM